MKMKCFPIATAPRDGRVIWVMDDNVGAFAMAWDATATNELFAPGETGMWVAADCSFTWKNGEDGPTQWAPLAPSEAAALERAS